MDEFEQAVSIAYTMDPSISEDVKKRACDYCTQLRESGYGWKLCLEKLPQWTASADELVASGRSPMSDYSKFFCLEVLNYAVTHKYTTLSSEERNAIRSGILIFIRQLACLGRQPHFLIGKLTTLLIAMVRHDFPSEWPGFFDDFLSVLAQQASELSITIFLRMLIALEEDVIQSDPSFAITSKQNAIATRTAYTMDPFDAASQAMRIKDALRAGALPRIVAAIHSIVYAFVQENNKTKQGGVGGSSSPSSKISTLASASGPGAFATAELASLALATLARYVAWIDIGLVVNPQFFPLIYSLMDVPVARESAALLLTRICSKGMAAVARVQVYSQIRIMGALQSFNFTTAGTEGTESGLPGADNFSIAMARLLGTIGAQAVEAFNELASPFVSGSQLYIQSLTRSTKAKTSISAKSIFAGGDKNTGSSTPSSASENDFLFSFGLNGYLSVLRGSGAAVTVSPSLGITEEEKDLTTPPSLALALEGASEVPSSSLGTLAQVYASTAALPAGERLERAEALVALVRLLERLLALAVACLENSQFELGREVTPFLAAAATLLRLPGVFPAKYTAIRGALTTAVVRALKFPSWYEYNPERALIHMRSSTGSAAAAALEAASESGSLSTTPAEFEDQEEEFEQYRSHCLERLLKLLAQADKKFVADYLLSIFTQAHSALVNEVLRAGEHSPVRIFVRDRASGAEMEYDVARQTQSPLLAVSLPGPNGPTGAPSTGSVALALAESYAPTNSSTGHDVITTFTHPQHGFRVELSSLSSRSLQSVAGLPYAEVEHPLRLMYLLGEILGPLVLSKAHRSLWTGVFIALLGSPLTFHPHPIVLEAVFDNISRFDRAAEACPGIVPAICRVFSDQRGLSSSIYGVRARAAHSLLRFCKGVDEGARHILRGPSSAGAILPVATALISARLARGLSRTRAPLGLEDTVHLTEATALMTSRAVFAAPSPQHASYAGSLDMASVQPTLDLAEAQREFVSMFTLASRVVLEPFTRAVASLDTWAAQDSALATERVCEFTALTTSLFRVLTPVDVGLPEIAGIVREGARLVLAALKRFPNDEALRGRAVALLHCLIDVLRQHSVQVCLEYLPTLLETSTPANLVVVVQLVNNIICRFKIACLQIVGALFSPIVERTLTTIRAFGDVSVTNGGVATGSTAQGLEDVNLSAAMSQQRTQCMDVRRIFYTFLRDIFTHSLHTVLVDSANERATMEALRLTQEGLTIISDVAIMKTAIHLLSQFIRLWHMDANKAQLEAAAAASTTSPLAVPAGTPTEIISNPTLRSFVLQEVIPQVVRIPFVRELNFRDAAFMSLLRETSNMFKTTYFAIGDEFLKVLFDQLQSHLHMAPAPVEAMVMLFQRNAEPDVCVASLRDIIVAKRKEMEKQLR